MKITSEYIKDIEGAITYNSASTDEYARVRIIEMIKAILSGETLTVEHENIELKTIGDYKNWIKNNEILNVYNTDEFIKELKTSPRWLKFRESIK